MQVLRLEVGVDFGDGGGGMAKKTLHFVEGGAALDKPGGKQLSRTLNANVLNTNNARKVRLLVDERQKESQD